MPNTSDKKMNILQACTKVFSQKGYHKATVEDIANEAGIGKGTVYLYFSSKKELFEKMLKYSLDQYYNGISKILSNDMSVRERLMELARFHEKYILEYINLVQAIIGQSAPISSDRIKAMAKEERQRLVKILYKLIDDGITKGEVRNDINKAIAVTSIIATMSQYYIDQLNINKTHSNDIDPSELVDFLVRSIS